MIEIVIDEADRSRVLRPVSVFWPDINTWAIAGKSILFISVPLAALLAAGRDGSSDWVPVAIAQVLIVIASVGSTEMLGRKLASVVRRASMFTGATTFRLDETGVEMENSVCRAAYRWAAFEDVVEEADRFVFALTPYACPVIGKSEMTADQVSAVRSLVEAARTSGAFKGAV